MTVDTLTRYLLERKMMSVLVADERGRVLGFVSMIDLVRDHYLNGDTTAEDTVTNKESAVDLLKRVFRGQSRSGFHIENGGPAHATSATVGTIMMPFVLALFENAPINEAAALMAMENVHSIVIVDQAQRAVGTVSALDILRWWAKREGVSGDDGEKESRRSADWRASCEYST